MIKGFGFVCTIVKQFWCGQFDALIIFFPRSESAANELHDCGIKFLDLHKALTLEYIRLGWFESQRIMGEQKHFLSTKTEQKQFSQTI